MANGPEVTGDSSETEAEEAVDPGSRRRPGLLGSKRTRRLLRDLHQKTWELELLISGAVALALTFVPGRVDGFYYRIEAQLAGVPYLLSFFAFYYVKLILYTLILAFSFHLVVRAFWVGLVGLDSTYPRGIAWTRLRNGPRTTRAFRKVLPSIRELIVYSDGVASVTFAAAFSLVAVFAVSIVAAVVFMSAGLLLATLLPFEIDRELIVLTSAVLIATSATIPVLLDRLFGRWLTGSGVLGWLGDRLEGLLRGVFVWSGFQVYGPIQLTLSSRLGRWTYGVGGMALLTLVLGFFMVNDGALNSGSAFVSMSPWTPARPGGMGVQPIHYEDRVRRPARLQLVPTIQTERFGEDEPWLRVFVPMIPSEDNEALEEICPTRSDQAAVRIERLRRRGAVPTDSARAEVERSLRCFEQLWTVSVDGVPLSDPLFYQSDSGLRGIAWFHDLRTLPPGRHLVEVVRTEGTDPELEEALEEGKYRPPRIYRIPFWN